MSENYCASEHVQHSNDMKILQSSINRQSQRGVTVIEYAMISGLIAVVVVLAVTLLGQQNKNSLDDTSSKLSSVMST